MKNIRFLFLLFLSTGLYAQKSTIPSNYQLVYSQDFSLPQAFANFEMTDKTAWRINDSGGNNTLELFGKSEYEARVRSPFNIALIKDLLVGDFILEVNLAQSE